mgnify:CR=1 FL=1
MRKSTTKWFGMLLVIVFAGASYASSPLMKLEYFYAKDGTLIGRAINGARQNYEYDRRGQLLAVKDANGKDVERYIYDPVGNILSKTVTGKPHIGELGYAFLFRNYRADQGKWQTKDPLGYPDGWNNLAYVNNNVLNSIDLWGALEIYVWNYRGSKEAWGHASMKLDNGTYISWWPEGQNRDSIPFVSDIYTADAIKNRTYVQDVAGEDGRTPDITITINGLDETAIQQWWNDFRSDSDNKWKTLSQNCSTTIADGLKAGNASTPWWDFWNSWNIVWTPSDIESFARAINKKLE